MEEPRLRLKRDSLLNKISELKRDQLRRDWRSLLDYHIYYPYPPLNIVWEIK